MFKLLKKFFSYKFHVRGYFNPFINLQINNLGNWQGTNQLKREVPIIISLTSYEVRFNDLPKTIYSLLNQSLKPDRIILWLGDEFELRTIPYEITCFIKNGLEIKFRKDIGSYTKIIYALKEMQNSIIVTADDDIYYPKDWLKRLYLSYISHPEEIQAHRVHRVKTKGNTILSYTDWEKQISTEGAAYSNFLTGVGGVLYPPNCFSNEVFREDIFLKQAPKADDIWLWVMALTNNRKIRLVTNHSKTLVCTNILQQIFGRTLFKENGNGENDKQLNNLLKFYGYNVINKLKAEVVNE